MMINESDTPINFYKVEAHTGVIGNEFADAITKHAALHNYGHDEAFPPPPIYTGLHKRTMRLLTLPLKSALHHYKT